MTSATTWGASPESSVARSPVRDASQPLVDIDPEQALQIAVLGHQRLGCGEGDRDLCGFADLADVTDGALEIPIRCDRTPDESRCPLEVPPFCP